jgi:hypothetical protein
MLSRREAVLSSLFGAGYLGLRSLATGLPAALLLDPRRALAAVPEGGAPASALAPQFVILSTSGNGDPINASVPGTYDDPNISHSPSPSMAPTSVSIGGQSYTAAAPWATLPPGVLARTCFWHIATTTPVHPKEPNVLRLMDSTQADEMLPSILARQLAPLLGTVQSQPISLGAASPSEGLTYGGQALPILPALALKATLTNAAGPLSNLQGLRDKTMGELYGLYKTDATQAQRAYVDSLATSQAQVRQINQKLLDQLASITDNSPASQVLAAITLIQMRVTPVIAIHIPFGGDNHADQNLQTEAAETVSGVQTIASLMAQLTSAGLSDQVTFMSLNVFGRTLGRANTQGRSHNPNHQVSISIGKGFKGGVIGGVVPVGTDYGAVAFSSRTGAASASGDVTPAGSLAAFGQTMLAGAGLSAQAVAGQVSGGTLVTGALAS